MVYNFTSFLCMWRVNTYSIRNFKKLFCRRNTGVTGRQINAIGYLVAASVEGLDIDNVVIVDNEGNLLSDERDPLAQVANKQFQLKQQVERALEKKVQTLMDQVIGKDRSRVRINVVLNFSQRNTQQPSSNRGCSR